MHTGAIISDHAGAEVSLFDACAATSPYHAGTEVSLFDACAAASQYHLSNKHKKYYADTGTHLTLIKEILRRHQYTPHID